MFLQIGILSGGFIMMLWKNFKSRFKSIVLNLFLWVISFQFLNIIPSGTFWAIYLTMAILGLTQSFQNAQYFTVLQMVIPKEMQGRIFSITFALIKALLPIGLLILGFFAESLGLLIVFIVSPLIFLIISIIILLTTSVLKLDKIYFKEIDNEESTETVHE